MPKTSSDYEDFEKRLRALEDGPFTTNFDQLIEAGVELPPPEALDDSHLHRTLWTVIRTLAEFGVFIEHTNHLSDRQLYSHLWTVTLREEVPDIEDDEGVWHVDILGGWSEEDTQVFLRHYADESWRQDWLERFPDSAMPPHEDPPFDRDRHLPAAYAKDVT